MHEVWIMINPLLEPELRELLEKEGTELFQVLLWRGICKYGRESHYNRCHHQNVLHNYDS